MSRIGETMFRTSPKCLKRSTAIIKSIALTNNDNNPVKERKYEELSPNGEIWAM
jgi:hypothetical protein